MTVDYTTLTTKQRAVLDALGWEARTCKTLAFDMGLTDSTVRSRLYTLWAHGIIDYGQGRLGEIIYLKATLSGDEPADIISYKAENPDFPHQTTADQFFDERQFEAYRALGHAIASQLVEGEAGAVIDLEGWFDRRRQEAAGEEVGGPARKRKPAARKKTAKKTRKKAVRKTRKKPSS